MLEDALWLNQVLLVCVRETHDAPVVVVLPGRHDVHYFDDNVDDHGVDNDDHHDVDGDEDRHNPHPHHPHYPHYPHHPHLACLMCFSCISYSDSSSKLHKRAK